MSAQISARFAFRLVPLGCLFKIAGLSIFCDLLVVSFGAPGLGPNPIHSVENSFLGQRADQNTHLLDGLDAMQRQIKPFFRTFHVITLNRFTVYRARAGLIWFFMCRILIAI